MTSFLLTISFLLHIVSLTAIYYLAKKTPISNQGESNEIMELLDTYLEDIKLENKRLQAELKTSSRNKHVAVQPEVVTENEATILTNKDEEYDAFLSGLDEANDEVEASLQARILQLADQGLQVEQIAKQLNCGKTEVELTIKLHAKN